MMRESRGTHSKAPTRVVVDVGQKALAPKTLLSSPPFRRRAAVGQDGPPQALRRFPEVAGLRAGPHPQRRNRCVVVVMSSEREEKWVGRRARFISPPRRPPLTFSRLPRTPRPRPARAFPPPPRSVHRRGPAHADPLHQRGRLLAAHRGREPHPRRHVAGRARVRHHARYRVPVPAMQGCVCRAEEGAPRGLLRARKPSALVSLSLSPRPHTRVVSLSPVPPPFPSQTLASGRRTPRGSRMRRAGSGSPRPCGCPPAPSSRRRLGRIRGRPPRRGAGCLGLCGCARWLACSTSPRRAR
jgi:hypothetical protein